MSKTFFITAAMLLLAFWMPLSAQEFLKGYVTSGGHPVEYANVGIVSGSRPYGGVTDSKGFYQIAIRGTDSITVRVSCTGYEPQEFRLALGKNEVHTSAVSPLEVKMTCRPSRTPIR